MIFASHIAHLVESLPVEWKRRASDIVDFIEAEDHTGRVLGEGDRASKEFLVLYHIAKETALVAVTPSRKIMGVILWYRLRSPWTQGQIERWRPDDADGKDIIITHLLARDAASRRRLLDEAAKRVPDLHECQVHGLRRNRVVTYPPQHFNRLLSN